MFEIRRDEAGHIMLKGRLDALQAKKARFIQEAKAAAAINHTNVCVIHDVQEYKRIFKFHLIFWDIFKNLF